MQSVGDQHGRRERECDHRRTRSFPALPSDSEPPSDSDSRAARGHAPHRSESSLAVPVGRDVPVLPPLVLPAEDLGMPDVPMTPTRPPGRRSRSELGPLDTLEPLPRPPPRHDVARNWDAPNWEVPLFEDRRRDDPSPDANEEEGVREPPDGVIGKIMVFLGYAGSNAKARRAFVSLILSMSWWGIQFVVVIVLLAYSASRKSPTMPDLTEWSACDRPLGTWNALWIVKILLSAMLSLWGWRHARPNTIHERRPQRRRDNSDTELATQRVLNGQPHYPGNASGRAVSPHPQPRRATGLSYEGTSGGSNEGDAQNTPQSQLYARISLCTSFLTLAWFLTAHVLEYTSVNTCRHSSPHLWWLTFALLCTLYLMVLEIFLLGLLVFILGPVLYLVYNILLLCLGRHPLQNPHYIKPDVDKLPKSAVDQIPLVLYIPPPPGETTPTIPAPSPAHLYPPKRPTQSPAAPKRRFAFFRRKGAGKQGKDSSLTWPKGSRNSNSESEKKTMTGSDKGGEKDDDDDEEVPWDEIWERGEYPFVRLEGNRAVCAICLMDFEEPKRIRGAKISSADADANANPSVSANAEPGPSSLPAEGDEREGAKESTGGQGAEETQEIQVEAVTEEERDALKLDDAGDGASEGPQPLRLLSCGHVFHQICLDPWLTDVSGRCPICQRPVEIPEPTKKGKRRRRGRS